MTLVEEVEGLREAAQHNGVDDAKGEHVARDHRVDHGHKGSSEANGSTEECQEQTSNSSRSRSK